MNGKKLYYFIIQNTREGKGGVLIVRNVYETSHTKSAKYKITGNWE